jgi:hypothetical protein
MDAKTKAVPVEPTEEMGKAAWATMSDEFYNVGIHLNMMAAMRAAIAAAPTPAERVVDPVAKDMPGYPTKVVMPNGDVLHRSLGESSWSIETKEYGFCVSGEQDWELVERYGLDAMYAAALCAAPQPAASGVPHDVVREALLSAIAALETADQTVEIRGAQLVAREALATPAPSTSTEEIVKLDDADDPITAAYVAGWQARHVVGGSRSTSTEEALRAENARLVLHIATSHDHARGEKAEAEVQAAREFVLRHPRLTETDRAEFEAFLKVPAAFVALSR